MEGFPLVPNGMEKHTFYWCLGQEIGKIAIQVHDFFREKSVSLSFHINQIRSEFYKSSKEVYVQTAA